MFKRLLAFFFGSVRERVEAEEAYEHEFGQPPMRGMSTHHIKRRVEQNKRLKPMAIRKRHSSQQMVQDDPILNPLHPASPAYLATHQPHPYTHQPHPYTHRAVGTCDDSSSRHHGGYDSHHSSSDSGSDGGSSDSGSSSSCD